MFGKSICCDDSKLAVAMQIIIIVYCNYTEVL
jgi:hypothetical protein